MMGKFSFTLVFIRINVYMCFSIVWYHILLVGKHGHRCNGCLYPASVVLSIGSSLHLSNCSYFCITKARFNESLHPN